MKNIATDLLVTIGLFDTGGEVDEEYLSTVWAVYDSEKLYVAYKNFDPDPGAVTCANVGRDSNTWNDDECELFMEPANVGAEPYFQFCINAECEIFDQIRGGEGTALYRDTRRCPYHTCVKAGRARRRQTPAHAFRWTDSANRDQDWRGESARLL